MDEGQAIQKPSGSPEPVLTKLAIRKTGEARTGAADPGVPRWKTSRTYLAAFVRAIDGDTIIVVWDEPGRAAAMPDRVRLAGIDAPELRPKPQPGAEAARLHLETLCKKTILAIVPTHAWPDRYGRLIARLYNQAATDICYAMIQDGFANEFSLRRRRRQHWDTGAPGAGGNTI